MNRVPGRILGPKREKGTRENCIMKTLSKVYTRNAYKVLVGKPEGKNHLEDQGIDGKNRPEGCRWFNLI
jgi:hypothetical protein